MKVLVACEYSGRVRDAFIRQGHEAVSCDILPTDSPGPHYQGDVKDILHEGWDMIIAHPPCTHLSAAGAAYWKQKQEDGRQQQAIDFVLMIAKTDCPKIAIENPTGILSKAWRKPDQIINPFQFGEPERKRTCLWLKGLPLLVPTEVVPAEPQGSIIRKTGSKAGKKYNYYFHQSKSAHERSKTFQGIADAMAGQWGNLQD
jgi:site-specific DNA-cytosine methylase